MDEIKEKVNEQIVEKINAITEEGIKQTNVDYLGKLVDIHKDLANEDYWEEKKEDMTMRYGNYGRGSRRGRSYGEMAPMYGRGRRRDSRGRYMTGREYGEGTPAEMIDEMYEHFGNYEEGKEQSRRGNYSAKDDSIESLECMMQAICEFVDTLREDADSEEEVAIIEKYARKMAQK